MSYAIPYFTPVSVPGGGDASVGFATTATAIARFEDYATFPWNTPPIPTGGYLLLGFTCPSPPDSTFPFITIPVQTFDFASMYNFQSLQFVGDIEYIPTPLTISFAFGVPTISSLTLSISWKNVTFDRPIVGNLRFVVEAIIFSKPSEVEVVVVQPSPPPSALLAKSVNPSSRSSAPGKIETRFSPFLSRHK